MRILSLTIDDGDLLSIIRKYLVSGIMIEGVIVDNEEGTPQGGLCKALHKPPYAK